MPTGSVVTTAHEQFSHTIHNIIHAKNLKIPKTNGVPTLKQNYVQ